MKRSALLLMAALWAVQNGFTMLVRDDQQYIGRYKDIAIQEMQRTGIPASIKLAQAIQESGAGTSELSVNANNHFGIKCGGAWAGRTYEIIDDEVDAFGNPIASCFRVYNDAQQSFVEHSEFLRDPKKQFRYGFLFQVPATNYRAWAKGLLQAGYATDPRYADRLIDLIERYQLHQYDLMGSVPQPDSPRPVETAYFVANDVKYVLAQHNETLAHIAQRTGTTLMDLIAYNENFNAGGEYLNAGTRVYIQHKRNYYRGTQQYHTVASGETIFDIAQLYGVKLDKLLERNRLDVGMEPAVGTSIKLRGSKVQERPNLAGKNQEPLIPNLDYLFDEPIISKPPTDVNPPQRKEESMDGPDRFKQPEEIKPTTSPTTSNAQYYTVKTGDTLYNISRRYNTSVDTLKSLNKLHSNNIFVGQQLRVR